MKLSVSAYRAHASAHKKILDTAYQLNYGSTTTATTAASAAAAAAANNKYQIEPLPSDEQLIGAHHLTTGADNNSISSNTPVTSPRSPLNTSREEDEEEEEEDSSNPASSDCKSPNIRGGVGSGIGGGSGASSLQSVAVATAKAATQSWRKIRAVMAYYHSLRKIKRTKSNQRWMKLRTTVQLSSAIQKKPTLKREDSFLKRFSTRQIPEMQETVEDTGSDGIGGGCDDGAGGPGGGNGANGSRNTGNGNGKNSGGGPGGGGGGGDAMARRRRRRRRRRVQRHPRSVVNPDENFYYYWLLILTICVLYNLWTLIVRQSFPEFQSMAARFWITCDALTDIVFLFDVGVQLRTGYLEQGLMVYDSKKLAGHYLHSRAFLLDLGALCPLDLLQVRLGSQPLLRFPRFLKVYRAVNYYYMVESRTIWPNLWRVINLIHILLILAHWFGCFYFLLSEAEGFQGDWVYPYRPGDYATLTRKYLGSLYWSTLTLTTIGDLPTPETNAEQTVSVDGPKSLPRRGLKSRLLQFNTDGGYVFTIVSYLIGVFIFATIVGQVGNVITNRNANRLEFERLLDGAKMYMRHHKVPGGMKKRVLRWYDYSWSRGRIQGGGDINTALGLLPDKLKTELALHVNLSVLKKVTIFQECQPEFLHDLVLKMKAYIFTPGDSICRKGEVAREMFIIADGILEVLSETGRVLTTMKAGDFFGEIGILNLDGLNKRTADVRSVGYSELFSLSREDVLMAMKDYPEAQEILQALGRKRLMEVRNSARHPPPARHHHHHQHHQQQQHSQPHAQPRQNSHDSESIGGSFVGKIKNEAKDRLKSALRKSRTTLHHHHHNHHNNNNRRRSDDESVELEPLHATPTKSVLKRMPRVRSDEMYQEDAPDPGGGSQQLQQNSTSPPSTPPPPPPPCVPEQQIKSPLGAGLPLLSRLRLLKEKQDIEDIVPSVVSSTVHMVEPPEVIGAGLPLLQRLLLLKAKEDRTAEFTSRTPSPVLSPKSATTATTSTTNKFSFRERLFSVKVTPDTPKKKEFETTTTPDVIRDTTTSKTNGVEKTNLRCNDERLQPWMKLKQAALVRDNSSASSSSKELEQQPPTTTTVTVGKRKPRPGPLNLRACNKHYESIDDLSPEYCGLPFVKKLKILNERQKLAELESVVMKTRSVSLDIPEACSEDDNWLIRSHSEGSAMHRHRNFNTLVPASPESNETPERRNLKSILKKLSEDALRTNEHQLVPVEPNTSIETATVTSVITTCPDFRQLMRAPTLEGYAARHSKLTKSVTFNRDTLPSPPALPFPDLSSGVGPVEEEEEDPTGNVVRLLLKVVPSSSDDEAFMVTLKQMIQNQLHEVQLKFQQRFEHLEQEVQSRDVVILQLRQHIHNLELSMEDSYTGSDSVAETVITATGGDWEETNNEKCRQLLEDQPESSLAAAAAAPLSSSTSNQDHNNSGVTIVNVDSSTDSDLDGNDEEDDDDDDEEIGGDSSEPGETDDTYIHNANWEVEMLAAQMRQQRRSASFDQNSASHARPMMRRRLCRGYSADTTTTGTTFE